MRAPAKKVILGLLLGYGIFLGPLKAQSRLHVVSKQSTQEIPYERNMMLQVTCERSEVYVDVWERPTIQIVAELSAKHLDQRAAEADLSKLKHEAAVVGKKAFVRNYVEIKRGEAPPTSSLRTRYRILLPKFCPLKIKNSFGRVDIRGAAKIVEIEAEFSNVHLQDVGGDISVRSKFGEFAAEAIAGDLIVRSNRTDISVAKIEGRCRIEASVARISITADSDHYTLDIEADKSEVTLAGKDLDLISYDLKTRAGTILLVHPQTLQYVAKDTDMEHVRRRYPNDDSSIRVDLTYGNIHIL